MGKYSKYCLCIYNDKEELIVKRSMSCKGCAKKRMPRDKPACIRANTSSGKILVYNEPYRQLFNYYGRQKI